MPSYPIKDAPTFHWYMVPLYVLVTPVVLLVSGFFAIGEACVFVGNTFFDS